MSFAGQLLVAGRIPGERIATEEITSTSGTFTTTETQVASITASLVIGRTYRVRGNIGFMSTVGGDSIRAVLREDNDSGNVLDASTDDVSSFSSATVKTPFIVESEYTAVATGDKTFVVTGDRLSGSGDCRLEATSQRKSYLTVDYISG